jgi:hypothetical protein
MLSEAPKLDASIPRSAVMAFAPLHKRALGVAVGFSFGALLFLVTVCHLVTQSDAGALGLLSQYFYGYEVSWKGALVGAFWGGVSGFVAGWFLAFARNMILAILILGIRARAELRNTRDFLDHI